MSEIDELAEVEQEATELGLPFAAGRLRRIAVPAPDGPLSALVWGARPASVVLLHGAALNAHTWDATLLAWGKDAIALDLPGHGDSPWRADGDYGPLALADQVAPALRELQRLGLLVDRPVVVGQSLGGLTGLALVAAGTPVQHLVLVDVVPLPPVAAAQVAQFLAGPVSFASRAEVVARALEFGFGGSRARLERAVRLNTRVLLDTSVVWKHHLGALAATGLLDLGAGSTELWDVVARTEVPVDLVRGERGLVGADLLDRFVELRPAAVVATLDAGHNLQEERPRELAEVLAALVLEGQ